MKFTMTMFLFVLCLIVFCGQLYEGEYMMAVYDFIILFLLSEIIWKDAVIARQKMQAKEANDLISKMTDDEVDEVLKRRIPHDEEEGEI